MFLKTIAIVIPQHSFFTSIFMKHIIVSIFMLLAAQLFSQYAPRSEDHFSRRKVVNKIDLTEKANLPLVMKEDHLYNQHDIGMDKKGLVVALMEGLKTGKYVGYNTDSLDKSLDYSQVMAILAEARGEKKEVETEPSWEGDTDEYGLENESSPKSDGEDGDGWGFPTEEEPVVEATSPISLGGIGDEYAPLENYILFVEDRIFDKNKSDMVYDIQYIQLYFVDPGGTLRDRAVCTFKYSDVMDLLDNTQWKNKYNDSENRTMREIFELRLFNSYIVNVSNINFGVNSLAEAQYRKEQLVEFEHHLWSY